MSCRRLRIVRHGALDVEALPATTTGTKTDDLKARVAANAAKAVEAAERKRKLLAALASKEEARLSGMSEEEILAELAKAEA